LCCGFLNQYEKPIAVNDAKDAIAAKEKKRENILGK
jgi:hypothetical protein